MYFHLINSIAAPILSLILVTMGSTFFITVTSLWLQDYGYSTLTIAVIGSIYNLGQVLGLQMEKLMQRIGHIRLFMSCASVIAFCIGIQAIFPWRISWVLFRFVTGACTAGIYVVIESWLLLLSKPENRGKTLSIYMIFLYFAQAMCQWIKQFVDINTTMPFLIASILCSLSCVPLGITRSYSPQIRDEKRSKITTLLTKAPLGCLTCFVGGLILGTGSTFFPNFAQDVQRQFPILTTSLILFSIIFSGLVLQYPIGYLSDLFDRRRVLTALCFSTTAISSLLFFSFSFSPLFILILAIAMGGLTFTIYPLGIAQVSDHVEESDFCKAISLLIIIYGTGAVCGPLIAYFFIQWTGSYAGIFLCIAFFTLFLGGFSLWTMTRFPKIPADEQGDFVAVPSTATLIPAIDPRIDSPTESE